MALPLAVVTGATGGIGYEVALGLARAGHEVMLTGRNPARGTDALARLRQAHPAATATFQPLDVSSLAAVKDFAAAQDRPIGVLVNNAGVMAFPHRRLSVDGLELQFATNYLGHFALTLRLLPLLRAARVVNVSSLAHRRGSIHFDDLQGERRYSGWAAYSQSKLAMLMFGIELQSRSLARGWGVQGFAAHPGWSATGIVRNGPGASRSGPVAALMQAGFDALAQSAAAGARPILHAALDPAAEPGGYYGPCCFAETRGRTTPSRIYPQARDRTALARLWQASEVLTGLHP